MKNNLFSEGACSCGKVHTSSVSRLEIGSGALSTLPEIILGYGARKAFLLADKNTYAVAGEKIRAILSDAGISLSEYIFSESPEPDEHAVGSAIMHFDKSADALIGLGSGVINDISKIVSSASGKPYIIVATAPSMDGYASASSSVAMDGVKVSLFSKCPDAIIGDTDLLKTAPDKMLKAGLGDMIAKYISIAEWRISSIINGEYYCERIAEYIRKSLKACIDNADGLLRRENGAIEAVFSGLVSSGAAMEYAGLSRPASGVEHYFSHVWDMRGLEFGSPVDLHGTQCAIAALIAARLYEKVKAHIPDRDEARKYVLNFDFAAWSEELRRYLGKGAEAMIAAEKKDGKYDPDRHVARLEIIIDKWDEIVNIINEEIPPSDKIKSLLLSLGMPMSPSDIGICESELAVAFYATKDIRDKYVLSRLAFDLGIIEKIV